MNVIVFGSWNASPTPSMPFTIRIVTLGSILISSPFSFQGPWQVDPIDSKGHLRCWSNGHEFTSSYIPHIQTCVPIGVAPDESHFGRTWTWLLGSSSMCESQSKFCGWWLARAMRYLWMGWCWWCWSGWWWQWRGGNPVILGVACFK